MVRRRVSAVSNHEATVRILRDAAKTPLLRIRESSECGQMTIIESSASLSSVIPECAFLGAGPESILTIVVMDSGLALHAPRNDGEFLT
jgi:hypothetical protein